MEKQSVSSANLQSIGYDSREQTLEVEFSNGSIYQYYNVPDSLHDQIMQAPSKGQFLNACIKNHYPYSRVG